MRTKYNIPKAYIPSTLKSALLANVVQQSALPLSPSFRPSSRNPGSRIPNDETCPVADANRGPSGCKPPEDPHAEGLSRSARRSRRPAARSRPRRGYGFWMVFMFTGLAGYTL